MVATVSPMSAAAPASSPETTPAPCLLEAGFPYAELRELTRSDRHLQDPVYSAHKWWARRPRSVIRALVLAAHLPAGTTTDRFWELFGTDTPLLEGRHVGDCFAGGGTTLVEAARLGAWVTGLDVDPLAVRIARDELASADTDALDRAAGALRRHLADSLGTLYPATSESDPLHYFRLREVVCPSCEEHSLLYRTPVLARDAGRTGAVVRDGKQAVVCPSCRALRPAGADAKSFVCCGRRWSLERGTFSRAGFTCPACSNRHTLQQLKVANAREVLVAVEETVVDGRRRLREPTADDTAALADAARRRSAIADQVPLDSLRNVDGGRPYSYGFSAVSGLFGDRQALFLTTAFAWLHGTELEESVRARLELAISNAISSNNRLCGYATDYGRIAPAFTGVRSYALPILSVELNPLHGTAGRGTLAATLRRVQRSTASTVERVVRSAESLDRRDMAARREVSHRVLCRSAERRFPADLGKCSAIITDPPYYDYIAYSDLSLLHRSWLAIDRGDRLAGAPIYPVGDAGDDVFARRLGRALRSARRALDSSGVIAFTYHSPHQRAWNALAGAVIDAGLSVTAAFPVWADARSSVAHGHPGSCEWDLVWVCRAKAAATALPDSVDQWGIEALPDADRLSLGLGLAAAVTVNSASRERAITFHERDRRDRA
jgi:adenine-specific DNA methylase